MLGRDTAWWREFLQAAMRYVEMYLSQLGIMGAVIDKLEAILARLERALRTCEQLDGQAESLCNALALQYGVILEGAHWLESPDAEYLMTEIGLGIEQLAQRFFEACQGCSYTSASHLFREIFAGSEGVTFNLVEGELPQTGAMFTHGSTRTIDIGEGGRGLVVDSQIDHADPRITRYLVTHELMHIFSFVTGGTNFDANQVGDVRGGSLHLLDIRYRELRIDPNIPPLGIAYPFYYETEGYILTSPGGESYLPGGFNNWRPNLTTNDIEERVAELLNIWIWTGEPREGLDGEIRQLGLKLQDSDVASSVDRIIREEFALWLALAQDSRCTAADAPACREAFEEFLEVSQ
jgi:hypothetical protein